VAAAKWIENQAAKILNYRQNFSTLKVNLHFAVGRQSFEL